MTCRHPAGYVHDTYPFEPPPAPKTPDAENYYVEEVARFGANLVMKVRYPNCASCAYEGNKVLVFLKVTEAQALRWNRIDPHFRKGPGPSPATSAPPPAARFPASPEGWADACEYALRKHSGQT